MEGLQSASGLTGMEILIVEDSPTQAELLRDILERHGCRVLSAANGKEAMALVAARTPALVISDVIMPEMDGYELCRWLKGDERFSDIPVILLTYLSDPQDVVRGLECGADNFITKPYDETSLLHRIVNMLMERRQGRPSDESGGLEVFFDCRKFVITADRRQVLNFLLSTYEAAIQKNRELTKARDDMHELNEQLANANAELEAFSYTVSHDLRAPLTCIDGYSQVLLDIFSGRLDEESREFICEIKNAAGRMEQLITTILNFSQVARKEVRRETVNLSKLARGAALDLKLKEPERSVTLKIADGAIVNGDAKLLRVVLDNLIGNAWKYSGKRPDAVIEFGTLDQGGETVYFVRDNGAGFDMAYADKLFAAFERLHDRDEFEGIGIGLATVRRIIEHHGGRIWAEGEPGQGAAFFFTLG